MLRRLLFSLAVAIGVAAVSYGAAASVIVSSVIDNDLSCDPDVTVGWEIGTLATQVTGVRVSDIDAGCVGAELFVVVRSGGSPVADASVILTSGHVLPNFALLSLTAVGSSTGVATVPAAGITEVSVLLSRGSEPAPGTSTSSCELVGMRIDGWGLDPLTALVSNVRLTGIDPDCIGNDVLVELRQGSNLIADANLALTAANTGSNVVTVVLTAPGSSNTPITLNAAVLTGIQISVFEDDGVGGGQGGGGDCDDGHDGHHHGGHGGEHDDDCDDDDHDGHGGGGHH